MNASEALEEIKRIIDQHGDVPLEVKIQFSGHHATGAVTDLKYRSTGIGRPFIQLIAHER